MKSVLKQAVRLHSILGVASLVSLTASAAPPSFTAIHDASVIAAVKARSAGGVFSPDDEALAISNSMSIPPLSSLEDDEAILASMLFMAEYRGWAAAFEARIFADVPNAKLKNADQVVAAVKAALARRSDVPSDLVVSMASTYTDQLNPGMGSGQLTMQTYCGVSLDGVAVSSKIFGHSENGKLALVPSQPLSNQAGQSSPNTLIICPLALYSILAASSWTDAIGGLLAEAFATDGSSN